jgi:hypothetical protein
MTSRPIDIPKYQALLVIFSIVYLIHEFVLNVRLLDAVDGDLLSVKDLEGLGRLIAAAGGALFAARLSVKHQWPAFIGIVLSTALFVYVGQKQLIEYMVDHTSETERRAALHLVMLQQAQFRGIATLPALNSSIANDAVDNRAFISMMALTSWHNPGHLAVVRDKMPELLEYQVKASVNEKMEGQYKKYKRYIEEELPQKYQEVASRYKDAHLLTKTAVAETHREWKSFVRTMERCLNGNVELIGTCEQRYESKYRSKVVGMFGRYIDWQSMCRPFQKQVTELRSGMMQVKTVTDYDCDDVTPSFFESRLRTAMGLSEDDRPPTWEEFIASPAIATAIRDAYKLDDETPVSIGWTFDEFRDLIGDRAVKIAVNKQLEQIQLPVERLDNQGTDYVRAVLILPVAILFSLVFVILNFSGLIASLPAINKIRFATPVIALVLLAAPLAFAPQTGVLTGGAGLVVEWVIAVERIVYPIGQIFESITLI